MNTVIFLLSCFIKNSYVAIPEKKQMSEKEIVGVICESARQHMKPKLAACETLECVDEFLHAKEMKKIGHIVELSDRSAQDKELFMERYRNAKVEHKCLIEQSPVQKHDARKRLSKDTIDTTKFFLEKSGINAQKIGIDSNNIRMYSQIQASKAAGVETDYHSMAASVGASEHNAAYIEYPSHDKSRPNEHVIAHEVTHIDEAHTFKRNLVDDFARTLDVDIFAAKEKDMRYYFSKLRRTYELQAEIKPLLRFNNAKIPQQLFEDTMPQCIYWYEQGNMEKMWNKPGNGVSTHAGCTEMLALMLKIEDLKKQGQKPLYEKT